MLNLKERIISGIVVIGVGGAMLVTLVRPVSAIKASYGDFEPTVEENPTEDDERSKTGQFSRSTAYDDDSLMPCCDPEAFERWYETYEQETGEEELCQGSEVLETVEEISFQRTEAEEVQMATEIPLFEIDGQVLNPELQEYLYQRLADYGIEWFMPYAVLIAYQESRFNIYAQNPNMQDKGLFQFRLAFYPGQDIFNPYEQIDIFCEQMANRANAGCDVY